MKTKSVLANLGWPFDLLEQPGVVMFSWEEAGMIMSASARFDGENAYALAQKTIPGGQPQDAVRAMWETQGSELSFVQAESPQGALPEEAALEAFQEFLARSPSEPVFTPIASLSKLRQEQAPQPDASGSKGSKI